MADKLISDLNGQVVKRFKDMGDGSFAEVVSVQGTTIVNRSISKLIIDGNSLIANHDVIGAGYVSCANEGAANILCQRAGAAIRVVANYGVPGDTLDNIVKTRMSTTMATGGDAIYADALTNDIYGSGLTAAQCIANVKIYNDAAKAAGKVVIWATVGSRTNSSYGSALQEHIKLNALLRAEQASRGWPLLDVEKVTADYTNAYLNLKAGYSYDATPLHYNNLLCHILGNMLYDALNKLGMIPQEPLGVVGPAYSVTSDGSINVLDNPALTGSVAVLGVSGWSGSLPTGYTLTLASGSPTGTVSIVDLTDPLSGQVVGKAIEVSVTFTGASNIVKIASSGVAISRLPVGGYYEAGSYVEVVSAPTGLKDVQTRGVAGSSVNTCGKAERAAVLVPYTYKFRHMTRKLAVPASGSVVQDWLISSLGAGTATIRLALPFVRSTAVSY